MTVTILEDKASIMAAIATMHPVAKEAAQLLAHRLFESPALLEGGEPLGKEWVQACAISARRAGIEEEAFRAFMENHAQAVLNVALSIVLFTHRQEERQKKWGWIGKAAAVAAGVAIGAFFG